MRQSVREAVLPYLVARVVVLGDLGLAHFIVDRIHPATAGVAAPKPVARPPGGLAPSHR